MINFIVAIVVVSVANGGQKAAPSWTLSLLHSKEAARALARDESRQDRRNFHRAHHASARRPRPTTVGTERLAPQSARLIGGGANPKPVTPGARAAGLASLRKMAVVAQELSQCRTLADAGYLRRAVRAIRAYMPAGPWRQEAFRNLLFDVDVRRGDYEGAFEAIAPGLREAASSGGDGRVLLRASLIGALDGRVFAGQWRYLSDPLISGGYINRPLLPRGRSPRAIAALSAFDLGMPVNRPDLWFYLQLADRLDPGEPYFAYYVSNAYEQHGEWKKAFDDLSLALHKVPISAGRFHWFLSGLYDVAAAKLGKPKSPPYIAPPSTHWTTPAWTKKYPGRMLPPYVIPRSRSQVTPRSEKHGPGKF